MAVRDREQEYIYYLVTKSRRLSDLFMKLDFGSGVNLPKSRPDGEELDGAHGSKGKQSRLIGSVLAPAVRLFLRSLLEQVGELRVKIDGGDRQILHGTIPRVSLLAIGAVYQGLHLTRVEIAATDIQVNIGQVLKGKPLRLLHPIPIVGELLLQQADFNASLTSPLLGNALLEFLLPLFSPASVGGAIARPPARLLAPQIVFDENRLTLSATLVENAGQEIPFVLRSGLQVVGGRELHFVNPEIQVPQGAIAPSLDDFKLDFGPEVDIQELRLSPGQLACRGRVIATP